LFEEEEEEKEEEEETSMGVGHYTTLISILILRRVP